MLETSQSWNLFGYDLRRVPHYFLAGWKDFLWGDDSPVLPFFDEVVKVHQEAGEARYFRAGKPVGTPESCDAEAVVLPERLVLSRTLRVPLAAEADLESVVTLEVKASSPFPEADTCYGWLITERRTSDLDIQLVISSQSAAMEFIASRLDCHDIRAYEVWAKAGARMVVVSGFGEAKRQHSNRRRLGRITLMLAYCLVTIMLIFAVGAGTKYLELQKVQAIAAQAEQSASDAVKLRTSFASSKDMLESVNGLLQKYPSPQKELRRLSAILADDTWLSSVEVKGASIKIVGESDDAAAVMQQLLDEPAYARVVAPVAIKKSRSGSERFVLNLDLATESGSE